MTTIPLSSLATIHVTPDTRARMEAAGIEAAVIDGLTEQGGLNLLALKAMVDDEAETPSCYRLKFNPQMPLCIGCLVAPRCWRGDPKYLARLEQGGPRPHDADNAAIAAALARMRSLPSAPTPPAAPKKLVPPPPPVRAIVQPKLVPPPPPPRRKP